MKRRTTASCLIAAALALPLHSQALDILLTNDDGLTANIRALQTALIADGHDVVVSVPCHNQSGKGTAINFLTPVTPLTSDCVGGAAAAGAPGAGAIASLSAAYYVDGTPLMAAMYGLDVLAQQHWGKAPDLVISGPNEGQNLGSIVISSGTVSNAQYALSRGIPAIAVSADANTTSNATLAAEVAGLTVKLLERLEKQHGPHRHGLLLPAGTALNVNFPTFSAGTGANLPWKVTRFGNFNSLETHFVMDLGADPVAAAYGLGNVHLPGVTITPRGTADATRGTDPNSEALQNLKGYVTVTPMQMGYETTPFERECFGLFLRHSLQY